MSLTVKDRKLLHQILQSQRLMSIATFGDHPWIASAYYVHDEDLNLYFISPPRSIHSQHILDNPNVAVAITDSSQSASDKKVGLQIHGTAKVENAISKLKWMFKMYHKLHPSTKDKLNYKNFQTKVMTSKVYKVTPLKIKLFNEALSPSKPEQLFSL